MRPCVSVLIPVYNAEKYLREAVESALREPETRELLLLDDGSTDGSLDLCRALQADDPRISILQHPHAANRGEAASRNLLMKHATSEYVAFLDADDYFMPGRLTKAIQILDADPSVDVVYDAFEQFYDDESEQEQFLVRTTPDQRLHRLSGPEAPADLFGWVMTNSTPMNIWQIVARREVYSRIPEFNERLWVSPDSPVLFQLLSVCRFAPGNVLRPTMMYRLHSTNLYQGLSERSPARDRSYHIASRRYFWTWALDNLDERQIDQARKLIRRSTNIVGWFGVLRVLRPRFLGFRLSWLLGTILLPFYFPRIYERHQADSSR